MLKIVINGAAGRMGQRLVALAVADPDLQLTGAIEHPGHPQLGADAGTLAGIGRLDLPITSSLADIVDSDTAVIDFSAPQAALDHARVTIDAGAAFILGTTGLGDETRADLQALGAHGRVLVAPNMSLGVNLLFALCEQVAGILDDSYNVEIVEMHHNQKKDAPSGTAEGLGEVIAAAKGWSYADDTTHGREGLVGARPVREIGMHALRGGDVIGDHTVIFAAGGERLELGHRASSRDAFAGGALRAAKFLAGADNGHYTMRDVLGL